MYLTYTTSFKIICFKTRVLVFNAKNSHCILKDNNGFIFSEYML